MGERRVAVVGAGPAGLAALRALTARGLDAVAFERGGRVGGVWTLEDRPTAAYRSLHLITSRPRTEFAEHPMPPGTPDYPARDAVGRWLEDYVERFGLGDAHPAGRGGHRARRLHGGGWEVERRALRRRSSSPAATTRSPRGRARPTRARHVRAASSCTRSTSARAGTSRTGGSWSSGWATARWTSPPTSRTSPRGRSCRCAAGSWVIPKRLLGKPADQVIRPWVAVARPVAAAPADRADAAQAHRRAAGGRRAAGARRRAVPVAPDDLGHDRLAHRARRDRPAAGDRGARAGRGVRFTDGTREDVDAIVWCTGYRVDDPVPATASCSAPTRRRCALYKRILHLEQPDLFFVGLMQSTGSAFPILERQSQLAGRAPDRPLGAARRRARCAPTPSCASAAPARAGATTAARRCGSTSTPTCTSSAVEIERGREAGRR